ncbi:hypothetical protein INR49_024195 [Caranx melampygus]|nr:hypothetical protein INR49_024195 [Caranx melampygus]
MVTFSLLGLCVLSLTTASAGAQSSDHLVIFASPRDSITLSCGIPSLGSCSSFTWNMIGNFGSVTEVVKAGRVTAPHISHLSLLPDCSLEIKQPVLNDSQLYTCGSGALHSNVSLLKLELSERKDPEEGTIELHCFLSTFIGAFHCHNTVGIHIKWSTEDNTPISGNRFDFKNPSQCFSKLIINKKLTDHHRKWKCQLTQDDELQATVSHTTTLTDGLEEVFAAVGESVSLSCSSASSLGVTVAWTMVEKPPLESSSLKKAHSEVFPVNEDSSLFIRTVSALDAGDYHCSESTDEKKVVNKVRLHTLNVTPQFGPGGENLTLTCVLTCPEQCDKDFNLTWSGSGQNSWQSDLMNVNNTLLNKLVLLDGSRGSKEITCSVQREGAVMASKKWSPVHSLQTLAWLILPLGLLMCAAAGGLYICIKRKQNRGAAIEQSGVGMTHVYETIEDDDNMELHQQRQFNREATTTTDSFYDLLQAVN